MAMQEMGLFFEPKTVALLASYRRVFVNGSYLAEAALAAFIFKKCFLDILGTKIRP